MVSIIPYIPYVVYAVLLLVCVAAVEFRGKLKGLTREVVAAVYRVAIHAASSLQGEGITWLQSDAGVAYRRQLAARAYEALPGSVGPVPVGLVKLFVSEPQWGALVEEGFQAVVHLADKLELPEELPTA